MNTTNINRKQKRKTLSSPIRIVVISEPIDIDLEFQKINSYHNQCLNKAKNRRVSSPGRVKCSSSLIITEKIDLSGDYENWSLKKSKDTGA